MEVELLPKMEIRVEYRQANPDDAPEKVLMLTNYGGPAYEIEVTLVGGMTIYEWGETCTSDSDCQTAVFLPVSGVFDLEDTGFFHGMTGNIQGAMGEWKAGQGTWFEGPLNDLIIDFRQLARDEGFDMNVADTWYIHLIYYDDLGEKHEIDYMVYASGVDRITPDQVPPDIKPDPYQVREYDLSTEESTPEDVLRLWREERDGTLRPGTDGPEPEEVPAANRV